MSRAEILRSVPAHVRFISAEPLLGPLPGLDLNGIDWLIVGGESGPGFRPMNPDWQETSAIALSKAAFRTSTNKAQHSALKPTHCLTGGMEATTLLL